MTTFLSESEDERSKWEHPICGRCAASWTGGKLQGGMDHSVRACCFCGGSTAAGVTATRAPQFAPCLGKHQVPRV